MSKRRKILVADLLCGAGGSTEGAEQALLELGFTLEEIEFVCVNHWQTAIDSHTFNHPKARHYVQDIATGRPHLMVPEGYLDLLMASPTCTHHSNARGGKPTSDQQRSDPWHIITWLTELRVKRMIIENVWEFIKWGPIDVRTGRPIKGREGEYFWAWINAIKALGFNKIEWRKLNAADYGDATTRQRFIMLARSDGVDVSFPRPTHMKRGAGIELFPTMKPWRAAREIIDWKLKGRSIFKRDKDLAPKTLERIWAGAVKHDWPSPFIVILRNHMTSRGLDVPLPAIMANGTHIGLAEPVIGTMKAGTIERTVSDPLHTPTTQASLFMAEPFVLSQGAGGIARSVESPIPTIPGGGAHALISPYYGSGSGETCTSANEALPTVTSKGRFGVVVPVTNGSGGPNPRSTDDPLATMTTAKGGEFAIVMPVTHHDGSDRVRDVTEPLPTVTGANRGELAFIAAQFGEREGQKPRVHSVDAPTPTIAATGHVNLIEGVEGLAGYDILFRMLEPHELAAAMGFTSEGRTYRFAGTKTEQIKQIGNAVSVRKMKACVGAIMADAVPRIRPEAAAPMVEASVA